MLKNLVLFLLLLFQGVVFGQNQLDTISVEKAAGLTGQKVIVKAKVVTVFYARSSQGKPTFLNLEKDFPNNPLVVVIFEKTRKRLKINTDLYKDQTIIVTGKVKLYKDKVSPYEYKPSIVILKKDQIKIIEE